MKSPIQVSLVQMDIELGNKDANLNKIELFVLKSVEKASTSHPHLICLPELCTTGFDLNNYKKLAESIPNGRTTNFFRKLAKKHSIFLVGSIIEKDKGNYYNTAVLIDHEGIIQTKYRKIHLFPISPMHELEYFTSGETVIQDSFLEIGGMKIGILICFDIRFPEISRLLVLEGIDILLYIAEFPHPRDDVWKVLLHARAIENQIFVIGVNRVGKHDKTEFCGNSIVIDPLGIILAQGSQEEEIISSTIDPERLNDAKNFIPTLNHRHPTKYSS